MKSMRKIILLILSLLMVLSMLTFTSCGDSDEEAQKQEEIESIFDHIANESIAADESESAMKSETELIEHLYVLIPKNSSASLADKARDLVAALSDKTGMLVTLKYDNEHGSSPAGTSEMLIGNTNRLESQNAISLLKQNDYICRWDTGSLVICGGSEESTIEAIERFISEIVPNSKQNFVMDKDGGFERIDKVEDSESETASKKSTFNGYSVDEFSIVYDVDNEFCERQLADILCKVIKARSGYMLDVLSSEDAKTYEGKTITLLVDASSESGIASIDGSITLKGVNGYTLSLVLEQFIENIDASTKDGIIAFECNETVSVAKSAFDFSVMTYFIKGSDNADSMLELLDVLAEAKDDSYVVVNSNDKILQYMQMNLSEGYSLYKVQDFSKELIVVYNSERVKNVSSKVHDEYEGCAKITFELVDGRIIGYNYYLNIDKEKAGSLFVNSIPKTICFFEGNIEGIEIPYLTSVTQGVFADNDKNINYNLMLGEFVFTTSNSLSVKDVNTRFSCSAKISVNISDKLISLNNSLK